MAGPKRMTRGGHLGGFGALVARLLTVLGDLNINDDVTVADLMTAGRAIVSGALQAGATTIAGALDLSIGSIKVTPVTLTSTAASIAWNAAAGADFEHTFTENTTLANPTNLAKGMRGTFIWTQHASSAKTLAFGNMFKASTAGVPSALNMGVGKRAIMAWHAISATEILYSWLGEA